MWPFSATHLPYCGAPPTPEALWTHWNLDPVLLAILALSLGGYLLLARRSAIPPRRVATVSAGWAVTALALVSPLCALSVALFSARVGQHMILTLVGAPLLALGLPARWRGGRPIAAAVAFAALLAFWHAPAPYQATFDSPLVYWAMHVSLIGAAVWLWANLLDERRAFAGAAAGAISMVQMGFIGALITLSPRALYGPHLLTAPLYGLTALQDQQLGGAIMWAPGTLVFLAAAVVLLWRALERRAPSRSHLARASAG